MSTVDENQLPLNVVPAEPFRRGHPIIAWLIIVALAGWIVWRQMDTPLRNLKDPEEAGSNLTFELQGKYLIGASNLFGQGGTFYLQAESLKTGAVKQRLQFVILAGELAGGHEARAQIRELESDLREEGTALSETQSELLKLLKIIYGSDPDNQIVVTDLNAGQLDLLHKQLGWFGDLARTPIGSVERTAVLGSAKVTFLSCLGLVVFLGVLGLAGLGGLTFYAYFFFSGRLGHGLVFNESTGGIYAEAFATWLLLFLGLNKIAALCLQGFRFPLLVSESVTLLSLAGAAAWPVFRGIPWRQVRREIGLTLGEKPLLEPFIGIANYAMMIPILGVGVVLTWLAMMLQSAILGGNIHANAPSHPITPVVAGGDWWVRVQVLLLASVIAPIVEETVFRGLLYRHLREVTNRWGRFLSVVVAGTLVSFVFAAIHPQGLVTVPALMSIAYGLTLVREWRGTLIPSMVTHGISNGVVMSFIIVTASN